ncbi:MAG: hypothetical protein QUS14_13895 [Pyrinomonadaceae bacterium]|nr:hypothetical protein [Pyrinomonadaceae bacterium]
MVSLAASPKTAGELQLTGKTANGSLPFAIVNGESSNSGRSIFTSSTITTPEGVFATLNLGKAGIIEVAPNSSIKIAFDDSNISGTIALGSVKVVSAANAANFVNASGEALNVRTGETATAAGKAQDDDDNDGGSAWWLWAIVVGGASAGLIWAATRDSNTISLGGGSTVISPIR